MAKPFRSERLIYRALEDTPEDANFVHSIQSDPIAFGNSSFWLMKPQTLKETKEGYLKGLAEGCLIGAVMCLPPPDSSTSKAVTTADSEPKDTSKETPLKPIPIGVISLSALRKGWEHHQESYVSIDVAAGYRGKGYGSESIRWILNWGFQIANLHRITIECFSYNDGAVRLYEKLGFTPEGRKRKAVWFDGGWHDIVTFGMLVDEWRENERAKGRKT
jgi:hypothetical protein